MSDWREPITDRTAADVAGADAGSLAYQKGTLNADDLNRIEGNYRYLLEHLETDAIFIPHAYRNREEMTIETIQTEEGGLDDTTLLLLHGESLEDSSNYKRPITNNGVSISGVQSKFGGKSLNFVASEYDYFETDYDGFDSDFTIDFWVYHVPTGSESWAKLFSTQFYNVNGGFLAEMYDTNVTSYRFYYTGFDAQAINFTLPANEWVHLAFVQRSDVMTVFVNGTNIGQTNKPVALNRSNIKFGIVDQELSKFGSYFNGYMDEICISNVARWTANFTPPEKPYGEITIHTETKEIKKIYTDWQEHNLPWLSEINRIRVNYNALVRLFLVGLGLPVLADSNYLAYQEVNNWERIATAGKTMFENMEQEYRYCGVEESGGDRLL